MTGTLPPLLDSVVGGGTPERSCIRVLMDPMLLCPGKGLVLSNPNIDQISTNARFLLLSLPNNEMSSKSPFAIQKALVGIGGESKSVKRLRSGDLLIETLSAVQTKSFLLAKTFLNSPLIISPHKTLNSCDGVISEPYLLTTPEPEILDGFSDQGVIQVRKITIKRDTLIIPTKHIILTFNSPKTPTTIKAGYLNCKIRPYILNHLRCFKCQRFGHSQTSCRGQHTYSRCASVGHASTDCSLNPKCNNCSESHQEREREARKLILPQISQTHAQATESSTTTTTDESITKIVCPPLKLLQPLTSVPKPTISSSVPAVTKPSTSTHAQLLPSTPFVTVISSSESQPSIPLIDTATTTSNNLSTSAAFSSSNKALSSSNVSMFTPLPAETCPAVETETSITNTIPFTSQDAKQTSKSRKKKHSKRSITSKIDIQLTPHKPKKAHLYRIHQTRTCLYTMLKKRWNHQRI
ncbi:putative RNA-directed DNA polymerase from transposon BS [Trichonephila clavipes]|nr:putative RNA-directed DNA polymerase from transposon BS [Trichonephila clavipes]